MIKIWGRNTSSNVQKAMWAVGELKLEHTRIDVGGAFGKNKEAPYLAMNPNGLVPTLEEDVATGRGLLGSILGSRQNMALAPRQVNFIVQCTEVRAPKHGVASMRGAKCGQLTALAVPPCNRAPAPAAPTRYRRCGPTSTTAAMACPRSLTGSASTRSPSSVA